MNHFFTSLWKKASAIIVFFISVNVSYAQPGKDGTYTITTGAHVLNKYAAVSSTITAGTNTIDILTGPGFTVCSGDLIMIYQAQGATFDNSNTSSYGAILNYGSAGLYEFAYVKSVSGNLITTETSFVNSYDHMPSTQIVKVPQFSTLTISGGAVLAKPWKDSSAFGKSFRFGGLVVIHADLIVNSSGISASGAGFRGGALTMNSAIYLGQTDIRSTNSTKGGAKGESIAGYATEYDLNGGRYCMGAPANGGGGGNGHNAGGGGGANGSNGNTWTGQGVMIVNSTNLLGAWALSSGYAANGNALTNSSGGGHGGYSYGDANANATVHGPGNSAWVGDLRREVGGIGGRPLSNIAAESRIYFGGGGGAPHADNNATAAGTNGGGIVYLIAPSGVVGNGTISASGVDASNSSGCSCDGLPGGGAGGSIVIKTSVINQLSITAKGGNGGNQMFPVFPSNANESEGPGGGGGGGFVALSTGPLLPIVDGGLNGTTLSNAVAGEMTSNGSTRGGSGQTSTVSTNFISFIGSNTQSTVNVCAGSPINLTGASGFNSYAWNGPLNYTSTSQSPVISNSQLNMAGAYTLTGTGPGSCINKSITNVFVNSLPTLAVQNSAVCRGEVATLTVSGAQSYTWSNSTYSSSVQVSPTVTTVYTVTGVDQNNCSTSATVQVIVELCTSVQDLEKKASVSIFPNPNNGSFVVKSSAAMDLEIINEVGTVVKRFAVSPNKEQSIAVDELASGIYFLRTVGGNSTVLASKIVVIH